MQFIDLKRQYQEIEKEVNEGIQKVLNHGRYIMGPEIEELEAKLAEFCGRKHCLACSSGTDALLIPLMAWETGPGDAVFTTPFSFIATSEVIRLTGATPVFVDIDPATFNIDPAKLEQQIIRIEKETDLNPKAVIPVDLFGQPADYDIITKIANEHNLLVLEDAAQSFGGEYHGKRTGKFGHAAATSFFPAKPLGAYGDGGAAFTDDDDMQAKFKSIRVHGEGTDRSEHVRTGINGRIDSIQAAVLLAKLKLFPAELEMRQKAADRYSENLREKVTVPFIAEGRKSAWAQYSVLAENSGQRDEIRSRLQKAEIPSAVYYQIPLHLEKAYADLGYQRGDMPAAEDIAQRIFSLPMHPYLSEEDIDKICNII